MDSNPFLHSARQTLPQSAIFNAIARFSPTPAWIVHQDTIVFVNSAAVAFLGFQDCDGIAGHSPGEFLNNNEMKRRDGTSVCVAVDDRSIDDFPGGKAHFVSFHPTPAVADLDPYTQMAAPSCFTDSKNRVLQWNGHFAALQGSSTQVVGGMQFRDACPKTDTQLDPLLQQVLRSGEGLTGVEVRRTRPVPSGLGCDWLVDMDPVRASDSSVVGVNSSFHDITKLKATERRLSLVNEAIGESLDFGTWICDTEGRNIYSSESFCKLIGMTMEECAGFGWTQALDPDRAALTLASWQECVALGRNWTAEMWLKTGEGHWQPVLTRGVPVRDASGKILCWAGILLDTRKYKIAQEELEQANDKLARTNSELEEFAYAAGHDLQEPLRVIRMMTSLVLKRYETILDQDARACLAATEESAARMADLVRDLLDYARILPPLDRAREVADLNEAAKIAIQNCQASIEESSAIVQADPLPCSSASMRQIARVFQNLISNAIKYRGEEPPRIKITADRRGPEWRFCVADNGQGIKHDRQPTIFLPFKRLHSQDVPGSGLGLAVCKKIVEQHGGRIWVESKPGVGSLFFFTLPID